MTTSRNIIQLGLIALLVGELGFLTIFRLLNQQLLNTHVLEIIKYFVNRSSLAGTI